MKRKFNLKKILIISTTIAIILTFLGILSPSSKAEEILEDYNNSYNDSSLIKYTNFLNQNKDNYTTGKNLVFSPLDYSLATDELVSQANSFGYKSATVKIDSTNPYTFNVNVSEGGLYEIFFDYYFIQDNKLKTEGNFKVNGFYQYYEAMQIVFETEWQVESTHFNVDRYGNELLPTYNREVRWYEKGQLREGSLLHTEALMFKLDSGANSLTLDIDTGAILVGDIYLSSLKTLKSYDEYIDDYKTVKKNNSLIKMGAEYLNSKTDLSTRITSVSDPSFDRYSPKNKLLNCVSHDSFNDGNQTISYEIEIKETALYNIAFKYTQYNLIDLPVQRDILVDGEIPFKEAENYDFYYSKKWKNESLNDNGKLLYVYLEKGIHTISLRVSLDSYRYIIESLDRIMDEMSDMSLTIKYLTNGQSDEYRDWKITNVIPNLESELARWIREIKEIIAYGNQFSLNKRGSGSLSNLTLAIKKLEKIAKEPDQMPNNLNNFTDGTASSSQLLGNTISTFSSNPLGLGVIYLAGEDVNLPKPKANIFVRIWSGIQSFFLSFFENEYNVNNGTSKDEDELVVWVNRSRQMIEIMQQMADASDQKVRFSIMPDETKLILANASGDLPDVALGVSNWIPYDLALRGITVDLRQFDGYEELVSDMTKGALVPYVYEKGMYGLPESQDFWVLYYRSDILDNIGISVPETWDELLVILPRLQSMGLNFYSPISLYTGLKPFVATLPLFYQYGGSLYADDGMTTTLGSEENIKALKFTTDLFTIYDVPEYVPNFFNSFRYGTLPMGIANLSTYIQLSVAAPEIQSNWNIAPHLGIRQEDDSILKYSMASSQGLTMFESSKKKEEAWDFIEWWMSEKTQTQFIEEIYSRYGLEYLWVSANNKAFDYTPIPSEHKAVIKEQWKYAIEVSRVPAAYMIERSVSDAFSKVVYNGVNPRIALDDAVIASNRELQRKMEEFSYMKNGLKIKDYIIPTIYNIDNWLTEVNHE